MKIPHEYSEVADVVTVCVGSATVLPLIGKTQTSINLLVKASDQALYKAKRQGRNRIKCLKLRADKLES